MMDLQTIRAMNAQAGRKAKHNGVRPKVFSEDELHLLRVNDLTPFARIPRTGDFTPKGFEIVDSHFVDSSGFGRPGEPALTAAQFARVALERPDSAWGIGECGQFQIEILEFRRIESRQAWPGRARRGQSGHGMAGNPNAEGESSRLAQKSEDGGAL